MPMALLVAPHGVGVAFALMVAFQLQSCLRLRLPWPDNLLRPLLSLQPTTLLRLPFLMVSWLACHAVLYLSL